MMSEQRNTLSRSVWDNGTDNPRPLSSSLELRESHLWTPLPEQPFPETAASKVPKKTFLSQFKGSEPKKGYLGCSTWPRTIAFIIALGLVVALAIVLPIVLLNTLGNNTIATSTTTIPTTSTLTTTTTITTTTTTDTSTTTTTVTTTSTTTTSVCGVGCAKPTISTVSRLAYYTFDSTINDATGVYPASGISSPVYTTGYARSAISLDALSLQRLITSPMNLFNKSFTIQFWFYLTKISTQDNAFFGQQSASNIGDKCLFLMDRLGKLYMGFYADDTQGSTTLQSNTWYHAAFIYDNDKRQRYIYLNGVIDGQSTTGVGPYLGTSGSMTIGGANVDGAIGTPYFSGYLDELMIFTRAKTACELLNEATLVAYFPFDGSLTDAGPNSLTATSSGVTYITGYNNQGIYLSGSSSYFQIGGLISLGQSNYSYSIAFWAYPVTKGVLVHVSATSSGGGWCTPFITFTTAGVLITQVYGASNPTTLTGPSLIFNAWTHIIQTFSSINGHSLYINGALYAYSSVTVIYTASGVPDYMTVGSMFTGTATCFSPTSVSNPFQGRIDELRIYSRALSSVDACLLAQS